MPLFGRGRAPKYLRLGETPVPQAYLGEDVVFDGTVPAALSLPRATATAAALPPTVVAGVILQAPAATAVSEARVPVITAGATLLPAPAVATAAALPPSISAGIALALPTAVAGADALVPDTQVVAAGDVLLPRADASAQALVPAVSVVAQATLPVATAVAEALAPAVAGGGAAALPAAAGSAAALVPSIQAGGSITLPPAQATAATLLPVPAAGAAVTLPAASATAAALAPTVVAAFVDDFNRANNTSLGSAWTETGGDLGIASNMLAVQGTGNSRRAAIYTTPTQTPYQTVQFKVGGVPNANSGSGAVLRCNSGMTQMHILSVASNGWSLNRITGINGSVTSLASLAVTISQNDVIRVECDSTSAFRVYINGVRSGGPIVDTTWADSSHLYVGLFVQKTSTATSAALDDFYARDTPDPVALASDNFDRASLGANWTQASQNGGSIYLTSNEVCAVGLPSSPISVIYHSSLFTSDRQIARARVRWHSRNPEHSSMSVAVRANPAAGHHGVHFWFTSTLMGIATYTTDLTGFTAAAGTADYVSTSKFAEGALIEIRAEGITYTASVDGTAVLQGTFTTTAVPLTNVYAAIHGEDDSAVSGGGEPPANLDDFATYNLV
ncbi:hypothetical protein [Nocardia wallacei]|uniref:hypothetical protein n=1 Tax=Nocardia wallacei TaxID=480035 RepID=UPI002456A741|nr:hypothetical protein [Nocardia wallacei]